MASTCDVYLLLTAPHPCYFYPVLCNIYTHAAPRATPFIVLCYPSGCKDFVLGREGGSTSKRARVIKQTPLVVLASAGLPFAGVEWARGGEAVDAAAELSAGASGDPLMGVLSMPIKRRK